jgi:hypothetical protein
MTAEQIRNGLKEMAKAHGPTVSNIAKVKSVNESAATCELEDEDGQLIFDVRLRPVLNGKKSVLLIPKVGSFVLAVRIEDDEDWMIIGYDEITNYKLIINNCELQIDKDGFLLKKENETLKKLMSDLLAAIKVMSFTVSTTGTAMAQTGATTILNNAAQFASIETRFNQFLK